MLSPSGSWTFEVVLGENRWESFYLIQDNDPDKRIYPAQAKAGKEAVPVGPLSTGPRHDWLLDCRARVNVPEEQVGLPGDKYLVTFRWQKLKEIAWEKLEGERGEPKPSLYYLAGSWTDWECVELQVDNTGLRRRKQGWFSLEVEMTSLGIEFQVVRNKDFSQSIYPEAPPKSTGVTITQNSTICGPDDGESGRWRIEDSLGSVYKISFFRDPQDCEPSAMRIDWKKVGEREVKEVETAYYLNSQSNDWLSRRATKLSCEANGSFSSVYVGEVTVQEMALDPKKPNSKQPLMPFNILMHRMASRCIHPDKDQCTQVCDHNTLVDENREKHSWCIGLNAADKAEIGDIFIVRLQVADERYSVTWSKKR